jgi:hypothetical protein
MALVGSIAHLAEREGERTAVIDHGRSVSFAVLNALIRICPAGC